MTRKGVRLYHGESAVLDFLLSVCGGVQTKGVKGELAHHTGLQQQLAQVKLGAV